MASLLAELLRGFAIDLHAYAIMLSWVSQTAIPGDTALVMGARYPKLPALAQGIFETISWSRMRFRDFCFPTMRVAPPWEPVGDSTTAPCLGLGSISGVGKSSP